MKEPIEEVAYFGSDLLPWILRMCLTTTFTVVTMSVLSPVLTLAILPLVPLFLIARQHFRMKLSTDSDDMQRNLVASSCLRFQLFRVEMGLAPFFHRIRVMVAIFRAKVRRAQAIGGVGTYSPRDSQSCRLLHCYRDISPTAA
jgi:hypothetical protein